MSKSRLTLDIGFDYYVLGICCHHKEYRLVWALNSALESSLERLDDYLIHTENGEMNAFSYYEWSEPEGHYSYHILPNRGSKGLFLPGQTQIDFLFAISGFHDQLDKIDLISKIKKTGLVLTAFELDADKYKSLQNLIFE